MQARLFWLNAVEAALKKKSVLWLQGVRRSGKTTLCQSLENIEIFDCERPRHRKLFEDPETFFESLSPRRIAIDEIHRLDNPSEVLKIAADYFPHIKVVATGSSTLSEKKKFKDTLTDRKRSLWLTPMNTEDLKAFKGISLENRLFKGGLPPYLLAESFDELAYQDWLDSFWAKDVQELFSVDSRRAFMKFFELLALQSGGLFEAQSFASPCGVSRPTINHYLDVLELTQTAIVLRPFFKNIKREVISAPKAYFFDTGFISFFHGWSELHDNDRGHLWEHFVLNELLSICPRDSVFYWRNKEKQELDFVVKQKGDKPIAIECKWKESSFDPHALKQFRKLHPGELNLLICSNAGRAHLKNYDGLKVKVLPIESLRAELVL